MFVKVCGLKTVEQIDKAIAYGYDAIGVVTYARSKRYCPPRTAIELAQRARGAIKSFVVGMTYSDVQAVADYFDYVQICEARQIPNLAFSSKEPPPPQIQWEYFIYDASLGSGVFGRFPQWLEQMTGKVIVAGGLSAENVRTVIQDLNPFGVDVSSGVEKDGVKDFGLMKQFIDAVRH